MALIALVVPIPSAHRIEECPYPRKQRHVTIARFRHAPRIEDLRRLVCSVDPFMLAVVSAPERMHNGPDAPWVQRVEHESLDALRDGLLVRDPRPFDPHVTWSYAPGDLTKQPPTRAYAIRYVELWVNGQTTRLYLGRKGPKPSTNTRRRKGR
jgi:hypothetical protein